MTLLLYRSNLDNLTITVKKLTKENKELKEKLNNLTSENYKKSNNDDGNMLVLRQENQEFRKENKESKEKISLLTTENDNLKQKIIDLENENKELLLKIAKMEKNINNLKNELNETKNMFLRDHERLDRMMNSLSLRECAATFEKYVILEIVGSKNKIKNEKIRSIEILRNKYPNDFNKSKWNDKEDLLYMVHNFKSGGDMLAHKMMINKSELANYFTQEILPEHEEYSKYFNEFIDFIDSSCKNDKKTFGTAPYQY